MRPVEITLGPMTAADADAIAQSQTPAAGGEQSLTLNGTLVSGGVATLDIARRVAITSAGDDTGRTFTITGTNRHGDTITEAVTGANAASVNTLLDYKTVTEVTVDDDTAGAITVGTSQVASTQWYPLDTLRNPTNIGIRITQDGTATWTIEHTLEAVMRSTGPFRVGEHDTLVSQSASAQGNYGYGVAAIRLTTEAYTNPATLTLDIVQSGLQGG